MTQKEFNGLPLVLRAKHLHEIAGLNKNGLKSLRETNPQIVLRRHGGKDKGHVAYSKVEVAKLFRLIYE